MNTYLVYKSPASGELIGFRKSDHDQEQWDRIKSRVAGLDAAAWMFGDAESAVKFGDKIDWQIDEANGPLIEQENTDD